MIAVLAVVMALALPAIAPAREQSRRTAELAGARQVYIAVQLYGTEFRDRFPFLKEPGELDRPGRIRGEIIEPMSYFGGQSSFYVNLLWPAYLTTIEGLGGDNAREVVKNGWPESVRRSSVWLTYTAFSRSGYWVEREFPPYASEWLDAGAWADVAFPSQKGLLLDVRAMSRLQLRTTPREAGPVFPWGVVWADGAARRLDVDIERPWDVLERRRAPFAWPVMSTRGGLGGRDFELK